MRHVFGFASTVSYRARIADVSTAPPIAAAKCPVSPSSITVECLGVNVDEELSSAPLMVADVLPNAKFFGCSDLQWSRLAPDPKTCEPGDIVVYRTGEGDPNETIAQALARGAAGILSEQMLPCPLPQCIVGNVDRALAQIAAAVHDAPDRKLLTVGILGTSGKTSTCLLAATVANSIGIRTAYQCDLGSSDGLVNETSTRSVPVGAELIEWLGEAGDCCSRAALVEIDDAAARGGRYDSIEFDVLIVAGRSQLANDFGPSGLHCAIERLTPGGVVIVPSADKKAIRMLEQSECHHVTYGTSQQSDFGATMIDQSGGMTTLMLTSDQTSVMMETPLCGRGMACNIAAAAAFAALLGHPLADTAKDLATLRSIPGRGQRLVEFGCATVVLESGGAVDRVVESLRTAKAVGVGGRIWCVFAIGDHDDEQSLAAYGHALEKHCHHCVVTSRPEVTNSFLKCSHQLLDGVKECAAVRLVADRTRAIGWALEACGPRDTVVVIANPSSDQSAANRRRDLSQLESIIESYRVPNDGMEDGSTEGEPISLKLFR